MASFERSSAALLMGHAHPPTRGLVHPLKVEYLYLWVFRRHSGASSSASAEQEVRGFVLPVDPPAHRARTSNPTLRVGFWP